MHARPLNLALAGVVLVSAILTAVAQLQASVVTKQHVTMLALIVCGAITSFTGMRRARHSCGRRRRAWRVLSTAVICGVAGNLWGLGVNLSTLPNSWSALTNVMLMIALVLCLVGLVLFPEVRRRGTDVARLVLDGLVVGGSVLYVASVTVFPRLLAGQDTSFATQVQLLSLPVMDVLIATLATLLITRSGRASRAALWLVGGGFWLYAMSDMAYAVRSARELAPLGSWWDLGWLCGYLLLTLAALQPDPDQGAPQQREESSAVLSTIVVFSLFLTATAVSIGQVLGDSWVGGRRAVWALLILAVVGRQIMLVIDNETLRRGLAGRVRLRTRELRRITEQQELLLTSVADGIYGVDRDGRINRVNAATTRLLRRSEAELVGRLAHELFHAPQADGTPFPAEGCYINEAIESGVTVTGEQDVYVRGDGKHIVVEATASPLGTGNGQAGDNGYEGANENGAGGGNGNHGAVVVFRDVSERHHMEQMKRDFVSLVSHELRTPLTSIRGALSLVAAGTMGPIPPQAGRMITIASTGAERLGRLVNDILDLERIESGVMPMDIGDHDVSDICREAVAEVTGVAELARVEIRLGHCCGRVHGDRDRTIQTLVNLLGNAVRFSDDGSHVHLEAVPRPGKVVFSVTDHGRGIPEEQLETIFGRFSQVDASDAREKAGTGLGLAICRTITDRLKGRIWAESTYGEGATFRVELPATTERQR